MGLIKIANIAAKILLIGLLVHLVLNPDLPQYQNKGMAWRLALYPLVVFGTYFVYLIVRYRSQRKIAYPYLIDLIVTLCITIDMLGNTLNYYDSITWWDDLMHFGLTIFWVLIVGMLLRKNTGLSRLNVAALTLGAGAVAHILWEIAEYLTFVPSNSLEAPGAYRDTVGDLALGLLGAGVGAFLISTVFWNLVKNSRNINLRS